MKIKKISKLIIFFLVGIIETACVHHETFLEYKTLPPQGWNKDSVLTFQVNITDTSSLYNVYINIRNRGEYPYQNLWLFLNIQPPHSTLPIKDTIECYLADIHGKWLGSGVGNVFEMPVLYKQNECFKQSGTYTFQIIQGMRNEVLPGISNVGLKVEKISSPKKHN